MRGLFKGGVRGEKTNYGRQKRTGCFRGHVKDVLRGLGEGVMLGASIGVGGDAKEGPGRGVGAHVGVGGAGLGASGGDRGDAHPQVDGAGGGRSGEGDGRGRGAQPGNRFVKIAHWGREFPLFPLVSGPFLFTGWPSRVHIFLSMSCLHHRVGQSCLEGCGTRIDRVI